jgi:hypothetical protein
MQAIANFCRGHSMLLRFSNPQLLCFTITLASFSATPSFASELDAASQPEQRHLSSQGGLAPMSVARASLHEWASSAAPELMGARDCCPDWFA